MLKKGVAVPTIGAIERKIWEIEHFKVRFMQNGKNVSSQRVIKPSYNQSRMALNRSNARQWKEGRFAKKFAGFEVDVLMKNGKVAHGSYLLSTVRDTYLE